MLLTKEKVENYEEAFNKIQDATGIKDIDTLVNTFIEAEDKNYSLYTYVNTLADDIEKMESQVMGVKAEIDKYKGQVRSWTGLLDSGYTSSYNILKLH